MSVAVSFKDWLVDARRGQTNVRRACSTALHPSIPRKGHFHPLGSASVQLLAALVGGTRGTVITPYYFVARLAFRGDFFGNHRGFPARSVGKASQHSCIWSLLGAVWAFSIVRDRSEKNRCVDSELLGWGGRTDRF